MTNKEIQALIDRYLEGETSSEEEIMLARELKEILPIPQPLPYKGGEYPADKEGWERPAEWQAVNLMLGELTEGEAEYDAIMAGRQQQRPAATGAVAHRRWLWAARLAAAASVALAVVLTWPTRFAERTQAVTAKAKKTDNGATELTTEAPSTDKGTTTVIAEARRADNDATAEIMKARRAVKTTDRDKSPVSSNKAVSPEEATAKELPDTLGQGIWQNEKNVRLALQMLAECEETIERSEQRLRNDIVEATFTALPQHPQTRLVTYDNGDYMVVDDSQPTIIEL